MEPYMFGGNVALWSMLVASTVAAIFCAVMVVIAYRNRDDGYEPIEHEPPADRAVTRICADFVETR